MKMYFYILKLMFYCWRHYIQMDVDDRPKTYYILTFKIIQPKSTSAVQYSTMRKRLIRVAVSKKPAREPYVIYNKIKRILYQKMINNKKIHRHVTNYLGFEMEAFC